jgi:regulator of cell morphogenesis and NO signaling
MTITEATPVRDIAAALPASVRVFQRHGIDFCCGGRLPIGDACREHGISFADVARAIEAAAAVPHDERDWNVEPLHALADHIVRAYHEPLRDELPRLEAMAAKVARVHGEKAPFLRELHALVVELASDLQAHMRKEEAVLFPAIRALEAGGEGPGIPVGAPISVMEHEHDRAGAILDRLRALTDGYLPPRWACQTFKAAYHGLEELEAAMHVHVHLENNVLFPRAIRLADGEGGGED